MEARRTAKWGRGSHHHRFAQNAGFSGEPGLTHDVTVACCMLACMNEPQNLCRGTSLVLAWQHATWICQPGADRMIAHQKDIFCSLQLQSWESRGAVSHTKVWDCMPEQLCSLDPECPPAHSPQQSQAALSQPSNRCHFHQAACPAGRHLQAEHHAAHLAMGEAKSKADAMQSFDRRLCML